MTIEQRVTEWLSGRDVGLSSKTIARQMLGHDNTEIGAPSDGADLGRCLRLLRLIPEWRERLDEMATVGHVWAALVPHWDELEALLRSEAGDDYNGPAPKTYKRISELTTEARGKDGWVNLGPGMSIRVGR